MCFWVQMLAVDLSVLVPGVDRVDGSLSEGVEPESISQWEADLLRERLQELLTDTDTQVLLTTILIISCLTD